MISHSYWTLPLPPLEAIVLRQLNCCVELALPQCGGLRCYIVDIGLVRGELRQLKLGSSVPVSLELIYSRGLGFQLTADDRRARMIELAAAQSQLAPDGQTAFVVKVSVVQNLGGALGVLIVSEPYSGLTGVIRRADLPGDNAFQQRQFALGVTINQEFFATLKSVGPGYSSLWQTKLSLRDVPQSEHLPTVGEASLPVLDKGNIGSWRPLGDKALEAVVAERDGPVVRLTFAPRRHKQMVINLYSAGLSADSKLGQERRFEKLAPGDRLKVIAEICQVDDDHVELRAIEVPSEIVPATAESLARA